MYPRKGKNKSENHGKGYCSDGVPVNFFDGKDTVSSVLPPPWPQPSGIFVTTVKEGVLFHSIPFLQTFRDVCEKRLVDNIAPEDLAVEEQAFLRMVADRHVPHNGDVLFRLYPHAKIVDLDAIDAFIAEVNGERCLRLNMLSTATLQPTLPLSTDASPPLEPVAGSSSSIL